MSGYRHGVYAELGGGSRRSTGTSPPTPKPTPNATANVDNGVLVVSGSGVTVQIKNDVLILS